MCLMRGLKGKFTEGKLRCTASSMSVHSETLFKLEESPRFKMLTS